MLRTCIPTAVWDWLGVMGGAGRVYGGIGIDQTPIALKVLTEDRATNLLVPRAWLAFEGMDGVFLMIPPNFAPAPDFPETRKTLASFHAVFAKAQPKKAVYLSSIGAEQTSGLGLITSLHLLEQTLRKLPIAHAFPRAGWFMENHAWDVATAGERGAFDPFG